MSTIWRDTGLVTLTEQLQTQSANLCSSHFDNPYDYQPFPECVSGNTVTTLRGILPDIMEVSLSENPESPSNIQ